MLFVLPELLGSVHRVGSVRRGRVDDPEGQSELLLQYLKHGLLLSR
jgi:hypothetical protein